MTDLICPICKKPFSEQGNSLVCPSNHCFDRAKRGYVNLLRPSRSSSVRHGDDKQMVEARKNFLDKGYYAPLKDAVCCIVKAHKSADMTILDAGCGEGYYTSAAKKAGETARVIGIDVSRDAIHAASLRDKSLFLAVASIFDLPVADQSIDLLINLFAPYDAAEFSRVLKKDGILIRAFPAEKHLWELKCAVYDTPYENEIDTLELAGFSLLENTPIAFPLALTESADIDALFKMTPYYYKTSREGQGRLKALKTLETGAKFYLLAYKKR